MKQREGNMKKSKTYVWANDGGHAWLSVGIAEIIRLGIQGKISSFSYVKGSTAYLEEDCDAAHFINAKQALGETVETRAGKHWDRWPGRSFAHYDANTITQRGI
jgi:hypothetical protein